jgi:replicative DNA helicase
VTDLSPPQDITAEQSVLGAMMSSRAVCRDVLDLLTGGDFYQPRHEQIFDAIRSLDSRGEPADPLTVAADLGADLERCGGRAYLAELLGACVVASDGLHHARLVRETAAKRRIIEACIRITQDAHESSLTAAEQAENARAMFDRAMPSKVGANPLGDMLPQVIESMESGAVRGLATCWPDLDKLIYGLRGGSVYVVGARPAVGKSIVGLQLATAMWDQHDKATYFASLEMTADEIVQRSIAARSRVPLDRIIPGTLTDEDWAAVSPAVNRLSGSKVQIADAGRQTIGTVRAGARSLARRGDLGLVVIDYLQLLAPRDPKLSRELQVAEASRGAKLIAKELDVPVVLLSQLNRATGDHGVPTLSNLRESGAIEQDADVVLLMHRPDEDTQQIDIHVAKNRSGPQGVCHFIRQGELARLVPASIR